MAVGTVKTEGGVLFQTDKYAIVKRVGKAGDEIPKHNHPTEHVIVTVVSGKVKVVLNEDEVYEATPGVVLQFDGENYIHPTFIEDGEFVVCLVQK